MKTAGLPPRYDENDTVTVPCSNVIVSIGQRSNWGSLLKGTKAETENGHIMQVAEITFQSAEPDIFGGGDAVTGPSTPSTPLPAAGRAPSPSTAMSIRATA